MKTLKLAVPLLMLLSLAVVFAGCPGKGMKSGGSMEKKEMMEEKSMEK